MGSQDSTLKGPAHKLPCLRLAQRQEFKDYLGDKLRKFTNFRACAIGSGICRNFLQEWKHWKVPFFLPSSCLAGLMLAGTSSDTIYLARAAHLTRCSPADQSSPTYPPWQTPLQRGSHPVAHSGAGTPPKWHLP